MMLVRNYQREQYRLRLSLGSYWKGNNYVFIQADGKQMYPSTPYSVFKDVIHRHNQMASDAELLPDIPLHGSGIHPLRYLSARTWIFVPCPAGLDMPRPAPP